MRVRIFCIEEEGKIEKGLLTDPDLYMSFDTPVIFNEKLYIIEEMRVVLSSAKKMIDVERQIILKEVSGDGSEFTSEEDIN